MPFVRPIAVVAISMLAVSGGVLGGVHSKNSESLNHEYPIGAPLWPPAPEMMESLAERQDPFFSFRPVMELFPGWMFPLGVSSTPGMLVPQSRTGMLSIVTSGQGSTKSPALFAELSTVSEDGSLALSHGQMILNGRAFISGSIGVERTILKKRGRSETFSTTVTDIHDVPSGFISLAGRLAPGLWAGVGREWRRDTGKTINEVTVQASRGSTVISDRRDTRRTILGAEYQARIAHIGFEIDLDEDERQPSKTYSLPIRLSVGERYWIGVRGGRMQRVDKLNDETLDSLKYGFSLGRQLRLWAFEVGAIRTKGLYKSAAGSGEYSSSEVFSQVGWGVMLGMRLTGQIAMRSADSKTSTQIVDKGLSTSAQIGLSLVR